MSTEPYTSGPRVNLAHPPEATLHHLVHADHGRAPVRGPFGRRAVDALTDRFGTPLHKVSPMLGHAYDDGIALRTLLGNLYFVMPAAGALLGLASVISSRGLAVPPALWLMLTVTVLGVLDAFTGLCATVVFVAGVVVSGHFFSTHLVTGPPGTQGMLYSFTGILTMAFFWFIAPQLPRRIRMLGFKSIRHRAQRHYVMVGDFFVVTLLMILILGSMPIFVPIFTGADKQSLTQVVLQDHLVIMKIFVGIAAFVRVGIDEVVHLKFQPLPKSVGRTRRPAVHWLLRACGAAIALALVWEVIGTLWQWPVVWLLLVSLEIFTRAGERFLKPSAVYRYVPRYLFRIVTLLLFDEYAARQLTGRLVSSRELIGWLVFLLVLVVGLYAFLDGADDKSPEEQTPTLVTRLIGIAVVIALFILSQDIYGIPSTPYANPSAVAVSSNGTLFIADSGNNRVIQVAPTGSRAGVGLALNNPGGVAADPTASVPSVYVANTGNNTVVRTTIRTESALSVGTGRRALFAATTTAQATVGSGFLRPTGLATDAQGRLFVADTGHNQIVEILPTGQQFTFATGLKSPEAVATDVFGQLYVADTGRGQIERYTVGTNGSNNGDKVVAAGLNSPAGVAADAQGNFFVADTGRNTVYEYLARGGRQVVTGSFDQPRGLAVDGAGHLYVADSGHGLVILAEPVYTSSSRSFGPTAPATSAALASDGSTFTVSRSAGTLDHVTATGVTTVATNLDHPSGVAWSALRRLYVALPGRGEIDQVNPLNGRLTPLAHGLTGLISLTPDAYGGLYALLPAHGQLVSISAQGKVRVLIGGLVHPTSLVEDAYGYLDLTLGGTSGNNGQLWRLERGTTALILAKGLHSPGGLTADGVGDVFYVERGSHRVWEYRGLLGQQIIWQGTSLSNDPLTVTSNPRGDVIVFPVAAGNTVYLHHALTDLPI